MKNNVRLVTRTGQARRPLLLNSHSRSGGTGGRTGNAGDAQSNGQALTLDVRAGDTETELIHADGAGLQSAPVNDDLSFAVARITEVDLHFLCDGQWARRGSSAGSHAPAGCHAESSGIHDELLITLGGLFLCNRPAISVIDRREASFIGEPRRRGSRHGYLRDLRGSQPINRTNDERIAACREFRWNLSVDLVVAG